MLSDEQILLTARIAAYTLKRRSPWIDLEEAIQEASTLAYEALAYEYDPQKCNDLRRWLATRLKYRLLDWQRKQKSHYYGRPGRQQRIGPSIKLNFESYESHLHDMPQLDMGLWLIEELSDPPKKIIKERVVKLSPREIQLLGYLGSGMTYPSIAAKASISIETVKSHFKNIREKLQAKNSTHAVAIAIRSGEIQCADFLPH